MHALKGRNSQTSIREGTQRCRVRRPMVSAPSFEKSRGCEFFSIEDRMKKALFAVDIYVPSFCRPAQASRHLQDHSRPCRMCDQQRLCRCWRVAGSHHLLPCGRSSRRFEGLRLVDDGSLMRLPSSSRATPELQVMIIRRSWPLSASLWWVRATNSLLY